MSNTPPESPDVEPAVLTSIIEFAESYAAWLEHHAAEASEHGHDPNSQTNLIEGWRFVALALTEGPL